MEGVVSLDFAEPQDFFSAASDERSKFQTNLLVAKSNPWKTCGRHKNEFIS